VIKRGAILTIDDARTANLNYYVGGETAGSFIGMPLRMGETIIGLILADRKRKDPFDESARRLVTAVAHQAMRVMEVERLFILMDKEKARKEKFYKASKLLNMALTLNEVYRHFIQAVREVAEFDFAAIVMVSGDEAREYRIAYVEGEKADRLRGQTYTDQTGLAALAIRHRYVLPHSPFHTMEPEHRVVFFNGERLPPLKSLKVIPLIARGEAIGSLVVGSETENYFTREMLDMLQVIANQGAVSIENGKMYEKMEQLATTDGLTGLYNHRVFQERLAEAVARADRGGTPLSLILTDIDHFKKVNDTYGHPVGDRVLKAVAGVLAREARETDTVARYGGEEFAIIMEMTDVTGAMKLAERIRQ